MGSAGPTAKGMLYALCEPGAKVPVDEFNEWYDKVHAPSRAHVPGVLHATRFIGVDDKKPEWLAVYEMEDASVVDSPAYKKLWETATPYETGLLDKLETVDRRVYTLMLEEKLDDYDSYRGKDRIFHPVGLQPQSGSDLTDEELDRWYVEEHVPMLAAAPGWLRSTRWKLKDAKGANLVDVDESKLSRFLAIHEFLHMDAFTSDEMKKAVDTPWRTRVMDNIDKVAEERRKFKLWKHFP